MKKLPIYESAVESAIQSATENQIVSSEKTYVVVLRFVDGFTPIIENDEVIGSSTSVHFKHNGEIEDAKQAYLDKLAELGLKPDGIDFTEEAPETFDPKKSDIPKPD